MLDDQTILRQRGAEAALHHIATLWKHTALPTEVTNQLSHISPQHDIHNIVIIATDGGAVLSLVAQQLVQPYMTVPVLCCEAAAVPPFVDAHSLVIIIEAGISPYQVKNILRYAQQHSASAVLLTHDAAAAEYPAATTVPIARRKGQVDRQRMITTLGGLLAAYHLLDSDVVDAIHSAAHVSDALQQWGATVSTTYNLAKQLARQAAGKTAVFCGSGVLAPVAQWWQWCWQEQAHNVAFSTTLIEAEHAGAHGWLSHPVDKPFTLFDLASENDAATQQRMAALDRRLSGRRPHAKSILLAGETEIEQILHGMILAEFASCYLGVLNGVKQGKGGIS
ncbi:MAG: SIS domain-containing protein [Candidatus Saccharibacteria bacterium]|nr:SIS domain-containing protein [Candidatus Saccharibacteria bacterium]